MMRLRSLLPPNRNWALAEVAALSLLGAGCLALLLGDPPTAASALAAPTRPAEFLELGEQERLALSVAFPCEPCTSEESRQVFGAIAAEVSALGLSLEERVLRAAATGGEARVQPLAIKLEGRSPALLEFVQRINRSALPLRFRSFHIRSGKGAEERVLDAQLEIILAAGAGQTGARIPPPVK